MDLFSDFSWTSRHQAQLDTDGHLVLPGLLAPAARERMTQSLRGIFDKMRTSANGIDTESYRRFAAEHDNWLAGLINHPQMLGLVRNALGPDIRYDHCVSLHRSAGDPGMHWHSHPYADERSELGFLRVFFYVNGFEAHDGGLKVVPGSHIFRDGELRIDNDEALREQWLNGKVQPHSGQALQIEHLQAPPGSVVLMWTHALHAVSPRQLSSDNRWLLVYGYRNPGEPSVSRWINREFEVSHADKLGKLLEYEY